MVVVPRTRLERRQSLKGAIELWKGTQQVDLRDLIITIAGFRLVEDHALAQSVYRHPGELAFVIGGDGVKFTFVKSRGRSIS